MPDGVKKILKLVALAAVVFALLSVFSGVSNIASIADRFVPGSWTYVFIGLSGLIGGVIAYPVWQVVRLPRAPLPPEGNTGSAYDAYQFWLRQHLQNHSDAEVAVLAFRDGVQPALAKLNAKADALVFATASQVFVETALSQNGRLDGLLMLARQVKLVWSVAKLYELQPTPDRLWYLYSNVAAASILSTSLEDMDLDEMVKPLVASVLPAAAGAIPGMQAFASIAVSSLMDGTANALLTLRLGVLTKEYALPVQRPTPERARMRAFAKAYSMLTRLTKDNVGQVVRVFGDVAAAAFQATVGKLKDGVVKVANTAVDGLGAAATFTGEKLTIAAEKTADVAGSTAIAVSEAGRKAADQTAKVSSAMAGKVTVAASATGEILGNAGSGLKESVADGADLVAQKARTSAAAVKGATADVGQKVNNASKTAISEVAALGSKTAEKLGGGMTSLKSAFGKSPTTFDGASDTVQKS